MAPLPRKSPYQFLPPLSRRSRGGTVVEAARANLDRLRLVLLTQRKRATVHEHRAIVAALARRDGEAAGSAMEAHLDGVMADLMVFADRHADAVETPARDHAAA